MEILLVHTGVVPAEINVEQSSAKMPPVYKLYGQGRLLAALVGLLKSGHKGAVQPKVLNGFEPLPIELSL